MFDELELPDMERKSFTKSKIREARKEPAIDHKAFFLGLIRKKSAINRIKRLKSKQRHDQSEEDELEGQLSQ